MKKEIEKFPTLRITEQGKKATISHTGSLAGNYKIISSALQQYLIIHPHSERELLTYLKVYDVLSQKKKPFGVFWFWPGFCHRLV